MKRIFRVLILLFIIILFIFLFNFFINMESNNTEISQTSSNEEKIAQEEIKPDVTFSLTAIGDIMCHNTQYWDAYQKETDTYDFSYVFENVKDYIAAGDVSIANIETSFAGKERGYSNYPVFNSPDELARDVKKAGLDIITTAGNHCLDMGYSGLSRTIDVLKNNGIEQLGTYKSQEERDTIFIKEVKGVKIAFIDYTYGTNGIPVPSEKEYCVNLIDKNLIKKDIEVAKSQNVDMIVACMHWGDEYKTKANKEQEDLADFLFKNGVNVIIGNHPHVLEQMEKRTITLEDGTTQDGFVIFACGNFICDQNAENTRNSIILNLDITRHSNGKVTVDKANYIPIYMYKGATGKLRRMKVLDIEKSIANFENGTDTSIGQSTYNDLKKQLEKIKTIVGPEIN
ncbi:MAG: CapA family protein [Clostridia bacterium]|nr:CapA family protein [Clostridia bacterium]